MSEEQEGPVETVHRRVVQMTNAVLLLKEELADKQRWLKVVSSALAVSLGVNVVYAWDYYARLLN